VSQVALALLASLGLALGVTLLTLESLDEARCNRLALVVAVDEEATPTVRITEQRVDQVDAGLARDLPRSRLTWAIRRRTDVQAVADKGP
jgi:hypothetical protein